MSISSESTDEFAFEGKKLDETSSYFDYASCSFFITFLWIRIGDCGADTTKLLLILRRLPRLIFPFPISSKKRSAEVDTSMEGGTFEIYSLLEICYVELKSITLICSLELKSITLSKVFYTDFCINRGDSGLYTAMSVALSLIAREDAIAITSDWHKSLCKLVTSVGCICYYFTIILDGR